MFKIAIKILKSKNGRRLMARVLRAILRRGRRVLKGAILLGLVAAMLKGKTGRRVVRRSMKGRRARRLVVDLIKKRLFGR